MAGTLRQARFWEIPGSSTGDSPLLESISLRITQWPYQTFLRGKEMLAMSIDSSFKKTYIKERRKIKYQHKEEMDVKRRFLLFFFFLVGLFIG